MFPINFNFPYRKKDGSVITMEKALDGAGADLDLIDLDDVAIQTPADNEGLVYNGSTQKWKNEPVVTGDLWAQNAAHNFLNHDITSQSLNDLTVTIADDKSITVSGATNDAGYLVSSYLITGIKAGVNYEFSGFPTDLAEYSAYLEREDGGSSVSLGKFVGANTTYRLVIFFSGSFTTGGDPITFKPMIKLTSDPSTEYAPYAMTNRELTKKNEEHTISVGTRVALTTSDYSASADGYVSIYAPNTSDYCRIDINGLLVMRAIGGEAQSLFVRKGTNVRVNAKSNDSTAYFYPLG